MKLSFGCELAYRVIEPTVFVLHVEVGRIASHAELVEDLRIDPDLPRDSATTPLTENRYTRVVAPPGNLTVVYSGSVDLQGAARRSRHRPRGGAGRSAARRAAVPAAEPLLRVRPAGAISSSGSFGTLLPGFSRVTAVCNWIYDNVEYRAGSSDIHTSACRHAGDPRRGLPRLRPSRRRASAGRWTSRRAS